MTPATTIMGPSDKPSLEVKWEVEDQDQNGRRTLNLRYKKAAEDAADNEDEATITVSVMSKQPRAKVVGNK